MFKLGVYACLGLFVSWVLLLILQLWFSFVDADLFLKITLTMAGLFIIILASLLVISQYFSEKKIDLLRKYSSHRINQSCNQIYP